MTIPVITFLHKHATSLIMTVPAMRFLIEIIFILKLINSILKGHMTKESYTHGNFIRNLCISPKANILNSI